MAIMGSGEEEAGMYNLWRRRRKVGKQIDVASLNDDIFWRGDQWANISFCLE